MDAFNDPAVDDVVVMSSAQVAKTTILENVVGYYVHQDPSPIMVVLSTLEIAEAFSKDRLAPMIRDTPVLGSRVVEAGARKSGNTLLHKRFPGGHLTLAGANSPSSLASRPIRILLCDEVARYPVSVGTEGDPVRLARKRTTAFWNAKHGYFSTPLQVGDRITRLYDESDRNLFFVPCPHCAHYHVLLWDNFRWTEGSPILGQDGKEVRRAVDAWFECPECHGRIDDAARWKAIAKGSWRPTAEFHGTRGFWLWQGYSPFRTALATANEWLSAQGRPEEEKSVKNTVRGEPWEESGEAPEWRKLFDRVERYRRGSVPDGVLFLTAGADVQIDRIEAEIVGWGRGKESWSIDYRVLHGDPAKPEVWNQLASLLNDRFRREDGMEFPILRLAIDSGYASYTQKVYAWVRQQGGRAMATKGFDTLPIPVGHTSAVDISIGGKKLKRGAKLWHIGTSVLKGELYACLELDRPREPGELFPPGFCHFPEYDDEFFKQLTAEHRVRKNVKGYARFQWEKTRDRNEALDCRILARAAAAVIGLDRFSERNWRQFETLAGRQAGPRPEPPAPGAPDAPPPQSSAPTQPPRPPTRPGGRRVRFRMGF